MMNMEVEYTDDQLVTIHFDNNVNDTFNKSFLMEHSAYFEVMFGGNFLESQSEQNIHIQKISHGGFVSVINSLIQKKVIFDDLNDLLTILEVSQFLQFPFIIAECIKIVREKYLFTIYSVNVFSTVSKLGIKNLIEKSQAHTLYYFKKILAQNRDGFLKLRKVDLQTLLNNNSLNINNEKNVFDLIVNWCLVNNNYSIEYDLIVSCVRFKSMNNKQLEYCISKTNDVNLKNIMIPYMHCKREKQDIMTVGSFIKPIRNIPFGLCAVKNELDGFAFVYRWDWASMQFKKFIRLDPLPLDTTGYNVVVQGLDVYVMTGEVAYGRRSFNKEGWKYNLLTEEWRRLRDFTTSSRRFGVGRFIGDKLYLLGGLTKHEMPNQNIELFAIDNHNNTLVKVHMSSCHYFHKSVDEQFYILLEYKGHLAIISKDDEPSWFDLSPVGNDRHIYKWRRRIINLSEVVICATCYNDTVYMLTYDHERTINVYTYCPIYELSKKLKSFNIAYDSATTMCAFNVDRAMVFKNDTLEYYSVDDDFFIEYKIQLDSFYSDYLLSVPIYIDKTL